MKYHYKHGNISRDWLIIILLYAMIFFMVTTAYFFICNYVAEGKLANGVCKVQE